MQGIFGPLYDTKKMVLKFYLRLFKTWANISVVLYVLPFAYLKDFMQRLLFIG